MGEEFEEIGHCGGKITVSVRDLDGRRAYSLSYSSDRPNPAALFMIYALPQGIPVEIIPSLGMGVSFPEPSVRGSYMVIMSSDREGWFGRACPHCDRYWRSQTLPGSGFCPYCGGSQEGQPHLTEAQSHYVAAVCQQITGALSAEHPGDYVIDLDAVADAVGSAGEKPPFYYSEERQQTKMSCAACGRLQDILGKTGYCCVCATRNDLQVLKNDLELARERARKGELIGGLRDAVSGFDGYVDTISSELVRRVPLVRQRRSYWNTGRPRHNLPDVFKNLDEHFGFRIRQSGSTGELIRANNMVNRRHVHEHRNGVVDQRYIDETGDKTVRIGQVLRETPDDVFNLIGYLSKAAEAMLTGFHELFPPVETKKR